MNDYIQIYEQSIDNNGLYITWHEIMSNNDDYAVYMIRNVSEMYEYGLAYSDKNSKKSLGKYYTPSDAGRFMANQLLDSIDNNDYTSYEYHEPCVGVGDLLLELLDEMHNRNIDVHDIIENHLHISDIDNTALMIANERIKRVYGTYPASSECSDFIKSDKKINEHDIVIMNPPYGKTSSYDDMPLKTSHIHDFYPMFLEKISKAAYSVSVTPQSFIGAGSYADLRKTISENAGGVIYAYDNVPAALFNGRKHGVFNTNTVNSTRAAITVSSSFKAGQGYMVSPLIRWKSSERQQLFDASTQSIIGKTRTEFGERPWAKLPASLDPLFDSLDGKTTIGDIASKNGMFELTVPASIRYYVSATYRKLDRSSKHAIKFDTETAREAAYIALNSYLSYAFWRAYDGGITITSSLLDKIPVPVIKKNGEFTDSSVAEKIHEAAQELRQSEESYVTVKMNAGKPNENVKFPDNILEENTRILLSDASDEIIQTLSSYRSPSLSWLLLA